MDNHLQTETPKIQIPDHCIRWLLAAIADGLQRLMALGLPDRPSAEVIVLTGIVWCETLQSLNVTWDIEQDLQRVQEAFAILARESERWPVPKDFIKVLPPRPRPLSLPSGNYMPTEEQLSESRNYLKEIMNTLKKAMSMPKGDV